ncbi:response regulator transcription factor [Zunongwangia sp. SCSIO 43204]|uniref:Two component transcriptional regulator, LuxR family n=1 Tax=Zunongwangia mangrovi TaxID=1334022 RepID=A0A1I1JY13_9FLAO|nr:MULTISPECIES: response regulator transcription factor [Zunongwangia]UAB84598.1 response regulator transcription factor [Zunongwangia sp. SCSIO 43204]SFC53245.1 two component transcriptional regulator, LuxR family [Zunongwangia mangrovi]
MSTVLIADQHPVIAESIKYILETNDFINVIGHAATGNELFRFLENRRPDVLMIEIDLPQLNGIHALRQIKQQYPHIKILVFSCHPEEMYALSAIKAGAAGYISKTNSAEIVNKAIKQVARGGIYLNEEITQKLNSGISKGQNQISRFKKLSSRETEVLNLLSSGKRNKDIAEALNINEKTVSTYKARLLKKLDADSIADLITQSRLLQISPVV